MKQNLLLLALVCILFACENKDSRSKNHDKGDDASYTLKEDTTITATGDVYKVDIANSTIHWLGKKPGTDHNGIVKLKEGKVIVNEGKVAGGRFTIDFTTIDNTDLKEKGNMKGYNKLTTHLKSDDFFAVEKYPTGTFVITKVTPKNAGKSNAEVTGNLTVKGKTHSITFPATINISGDQLTADASFPLDRSKYDIRYGSKTFFPDKAVDDIIEDKVPITVKLVAKK